MLKLITKISVVKSFDSTTDMAQMVGVEPTSKNISEELSPSAVSALSFAVSAVTLTHYGTAIL